MDIIKKLMVHIDKADSQSKCGEWSELLGEVQNKEIVFLMYPLDSLDYK